MATPIGPKAKRDEANAPATFRWYDPWPGDTLVFPGGTRLVVDRTAEGFYKVQAKGVVPNAS